MPLRIGEGKADFAVKVTFWVGLRLSVLASLMKMAGRREGSCGKYERPPVASAMARKAATSVLPCGKIDTTETLILAWMYAPMRFGGGGEGSPSLMMIRCLVAASLLTRPS